MKVDLSMSLLFEFPTKEYWLVRVKILEEISKVLHYHVGVVVRLDKPVVVLVVILVNVLEGLLSFIPEVVPALTDVELDSR